MGVELRRMRLIVQGNSEPAPRQKRPSHANDRSLNRLLALRTLRQHPLEIRNRRLQPLPQRDPGLPAKLLASQSNIRLALARVVSGQRPIDEIRTGSGQVADRFGQFDHGELARVTEVQRAGETLGAVHQAHETLDQVVHVAERATLGAVAVERDRLVSQACMMKFDTTRPSFGCMRGP